MNADALRCRAIYQLHDLSEEALERIRIIDAAFDQIAKELDRAQLYEEGSREEFAIAVERLREAQMWLREGARRQDCDNEQRYDSGRDE